MRRLRSWIVRLTEPFRKGRLDRELADELESHLALHTEDNLRSGMSPDEARRRALLALGGVEQTKESVRAQRGVLAVETLVQDFQYGLRMLMKQRALTLIALVVLTFGIGACIATFGIVHRVLLRPFPYHEPHRLVMLHEATAQEELPTSYLNFVDWKTRNRVFERMAAYRGDDVVLTSETGAQRSRALVVSSDFLATLGVRPVVGRDFVGEDDRVGAEPVVILGHALWNGRFHGDPGVVGRAVTLDGKRAVVIGVLPADFEFPVEGELLKPLSTISQRLRFRGHDTGLIVVARLKDGTSVHSAESQMGALMAELVRTYPDALAGRKLVLATLDAFAFGDLSRTLWTLLGAVAFVLLIACTNVSRLLLARADARRREVAVRSALGATRGRVIRQFLTESLTLSLLGGVLGLAFSRLLTRAVIAFGPSDLPRFDGVPIDAATLAFALGVSVVTGLVYGWVPALQISKSDVASSLKDAERGSTRGHHAFGAALVVAEVALALVLLIGGALMIQTFVGLHRVDPGFRPDGLLTMQAILPAREGEGTKLRTFVAELESRVRSVPGVRDIALADGLPYIGTNQVPLRVNGRADEDESPIAQMYFTTANYFTVMGLDLVRGRTFSESDRPGSPPVAVIDEVMARKYFEGRDPIGHRLEVDTGSGRSYEIVGIVRHVKDSGLDGRAQVQPQFYLALGQASDTLFADVIGNAHLIVRADRDPARVAPSVRSALHQLDPNLPLFDVQTLAKLIGDTMTAQRFSVLLLTVFGALALVLALVGLYGSMAHNVDQRRHEIGIRMALGARAADVFAMVVRQSLRLTAIGLVIGVAAAVALTRLLSGLLYGVGATDVRTFLVIALLFVTVALLATWVPARRASRVDPMIALRWE